MVILQPNSYQLRIPYFGRGAIQWITSGESAITGTIAIVPPSRSLSITGQGRALGDAVPDRGGEGAGGTFPYDFPVDFTITKDGRKLPGRP